MKKWISVLTAGVVLTCALTVVASASNFQPIAAHLMDMGLMDVVDLHTVPTRGDVAEMVTMVMGQVDEAKQAYEAGEIDHPFTDTQGFDDSAIAYLYENGYTLGATDTTFEPAAPCSAQMYVTFLLRAMGYEVAYEDAVSYATELGLLDEVNTYGSVFLWDNVAAITYTALPLTVEGGNTTLLEQLKADGVLAESSDGEALLDFYTQFMELNANIGDIAQYSGQLQSVYVLSVDDVPFTSSASGFEVLVETNSGDLADTKMQIQGESSAVVFVEGQRETITVQESCYFVDGWLYVNSDGVAYKMEMSLEDAMASLDMETGDIAMPISALVAGSVTETDGITQYTAIYSAAYLDGVNQQMAEVFGSHTTGLSNVYTRDLEVILCMDGDVPVSQSTIFAADILGTSQIMSIETNSFMTYETINQSLAFDFPTDLDAYMTYEELMETMMQES